MVLLDDSNCATESVITAHFELCSDCTFVMVDASGPKLHVEGADLTVSFYKDFTDAMFAYVTSSCLLSAFAAHAAQKVSGGFVYEVPQDKFAQLTSILLRKARLVNIYLLCGDTETKNSIVNILYKLWLVPYGYSESFAFIPQYYIRHEELRQIAVSYSDILDNHVLFGEERFDTLRESGRLLQYSEHMTSIPTFNTGVATQYFAGGVAEHPVLCVLTSDSVVRTRLMKLSDQPGVVVRECKNFYYVFGDLNELCTALQKGEVWNGEYIAKGATVSLLYAVMLRKDDSVELKRKYMERYTISDKEWEYEVKRLMELFGVYTEDEVIKKLPLLMGQEGNRD